MSEAAVELIASDQRLAERGHQPRVAGSAPVRRFEQGDRLRRISRIERSRRASEDARHAPAAQEAVDKGR
jgi:hypothetical protein